MSSLPHKPEQRGSKESINSSHVYDSDKIPAAAVNKSIPIWNGNKLPFSAARKMSSHFTLSFLPPYVTGINRNIGYVMNSFTRHFLTSFLNIGQTYSG